MGSCFVCPECFRTKSGRYGEVKWCSGLDGSCHYTHNRTKMIWMSSETELLIVNMASRIVRMNKRIDDMREPF